MALLRNISWLVLLLCTVLAVAHPATDSTDSTDSTDKKPKDLRQLFKGKLSSGAQIFLPSDPNYGPETTQRWSVHDAPTYQGSIKPAVPSDVQTIVKIAAKNNIPFLGTGGGHGLSTTLKTLQNGIEIDLSGFKKPVINAAANTMVVGGGTIFGDVIDPLFEAKKEIPTGSCNCVGFMGGTLGGGIGRLQGLHGLIADSLISAQVVTAAGDYITVSATQNADLFWGLRGAGVDFVIVVYATFKIYDATNDGKVFHADLVFPASAASKHFAALKSFENNQPAALSFLSNVNYNTKYNGTNIVFNAAYFGPEAEARKILKPFFDNGPIFSNASETTWNNLINVALFGTFYDPKCLKGKHVNTYSANVKSLNLADADSEFENWVSLYDKYPNARNSFWFFEGLPTQGVLAAPKNSTSFPDSHRATTNYLLWAYSYNDTTLEDPINKFAVDMRSTFSTHNGFGDLEVYVSYAHGDEGAKIWWAENVPTLKNLKAIWDPKKLFNYMNPL